MTNPAPSCFTFLVGGVGKLGEEGQDRPPVQQPGLELAVLRKGFALALTAKEIADGLKAADPAPEDGDRARAT
ncbi:hypothetical protein [Streptomyces sp. NBC_00893]|uniref:hypothetical protein n=1 Tax=Streptomyces sp. NBC_00893 TaxID=2975862 RepID=UPI0022546799|nr:hypothetical protein [Streptomyces sp. NBC_00893]MCX4850211.1 hypothetical protein [Streptomyces sp. NBC_00893]